MLLFLGKKSEEEVLGRKMVEVSPELEGQPGLAIVKKVVATGEAFNAHQVPVHLYIDGKLTERFYDLSYTAIKDESGETGVLHVAMDVTGQVMARKKVEESEQAAQFLAQELAASNEELRAANEEIQASNEELGVSNAQLVRSNTDLDTFIYTASHDLKAPIHNIEGLMKVLIRSLPPESMQSEKITSTAHLIAQSIERFKRTIFHLTEVSKLQKEANQPTVLVALSSVLEEVLLDLAPHIEASSARVEVDVRECEAIEFSEKNLRSILYNLLSNAIKYRSLNHPAIIKVNCQAQPDYHVLTVEDNGLGMDLSGGKREKLFTMFKRFHTHVEGSGIGLYMVKRIVDNAGGKIEVESQVGVGSTFRVYFRQ
jgi:signal transduction histidine kinase